MFSVPRYVSVGCAHLPRPNESGTKFARSAVWRSSEKPKFLRIIESHSGDPLSRYRHSSFRNRRCLSLGTHGF